jgi:hypothetical protein
MLTSLTSLMTAFFEHDADLGKLKDAIPSLSPAVQEEWNRFIVSPFFPNQFTRFLGARSYEIRGL